MKYLYYWMMPLLFVHATILPWGWFRGVEESPDSTYQQSVANTADARLAALKENRAKHAQIAAEANAGKYPQGTNFQRVSDQKQVMLDKPARDYFENSWFRSTNENSDGNAGVGNSELAKQLFQQNKPLIKENYRLANNLVNAQARNNALADVTQIQLSSNPISLISTVPQVLNIGSNKGSQTQVGQAYYKNIKDPNANRYVIKRSGISNQDAFVPEFSQETVQQYADRYKAANNAIKPTNQADLRMMLKQENSTLANSTIPNSQRITPGQAFSLGKSAVANYGAAKGLSSNLTDMYTQYVQPN